LWPIRFPRDSWLACSTWWKHRQIRQRRYLDGGKWLEILPPGNLTSQADYAGRKFLL
jgi:hypothetical protein